MGRGERREAAGPAAAFPWVSIATLCICSFSTAFNQTVLYPIVPFFVVDTGMVDDPREPGGVHAPTATPSTTARADQQA